ncbi:MAG: hypothetical protein KTR16_03850 [Acidiferrobacterales bacterium]|nr:hypothetical protein [Acidiferrobacterales bacterium]
MNRFLFLAALASMIVACKPAGPSPILGDGCHIPLDRSQDGKYTTDYRIYWPERYLRGELQHYPEQPEKLGRYDYKFYQDKRLLTIRDVAKYKVLRMDEREILLEMFFLMPDELSEEDYGYAVLKKGSCEQHVPIQHTLSRKVWFGRRCHFFKT